MHLKYEYIEHTADAGFRAYGKTLEELFSNAAEALFEILVALESIRLISKRVIHVDGTDLEGLMVNWLSELLYLFDTEGLLLGKFEVEAVNEESIKATVHGEINDPGRHEIRAGIKAVTYHQLYVKKRRGWWESRVFLDL